MFGRLILLALHIQISILFTCFCQVEIKREYYENKKLKSEKYWKGSSEIGVWKYYYEDGSLKEEFDKENNILKEYYRNGRLKSEYFFNKDGKKIIKHYFENGNIMSVGFFLSENLLTGIEKHYDEKGELIYIYKYRKGKIMDIKKVK